MEQTEFLGGDGASTTAGHRIRRVGVRIPPRGLTPRPFLKWAGGKGQLLPALLERLRRAEPFARYHEPFLGGAALFFELARLDRLTEPALLSDNNPNLMDTYRAIQEEVETVIAQLENHAQRHSEEHFYLVRAEQPATRAAHAARIIYLNRTCFNGLFRENSKGGFNVPFGRYVNPMICNAANLRACANALRHAVLETRPFDRVLDEARPGDFVYFDPPYDPVSTTARFTAYNKQAFGEAEQRRLAGVFAELARRGVKALLSNSMTPFVRDLYKAFTLETVHAKRSVNSVGDRRGLVEEALVRNF